MFKASCPCHGAQSNNLCCLNICTVGGREQCLKITFIKLLALIIVVLVVLLTIYTNTDIIAFLTNKKQDIIPSWDYLPCDWSVDKIPRPMRHRAVLECGISTRIYYEEVPFNTTPAVTTLESHDPCLAHLAQSTWCNDPGMRVPRLVHYVWFTRHTLPLYTFVSVLSAVRHVRPCLVLFHGDVIPEGPYWRALLQLVPNIVHVRSQRPRQIFGHTLSSLITVLTFSPLNIFLLLVCHLEYGGVYLDTDSVVLKSLDHVRIHPVVMGTEVSGWNLCNGMMLSEKNSTFLQLWLATYVDFDDSQWAQHSTRVPYLLYLQKPDLVHVVDSFFRPNYVDIGKFYRSGEIHQWDDLLALHLYVRFHLKFFAEGQSAIQTNCTMGEILRYSLHGASDACQLTTLISGSDGISKKRKKA
ncbi:hypothetical protein C0Q70_08402 [Pomacea canaliculata]|uniref:Alpha-1,4-N-acetylglucosaminyltransferase n=1 Tax=Pomacea canaliculata TaxID=400727 RepID=A0A2T7PHQ8_POMCA|nr:hypothetical protein C0Q70_08402 [Pomacea canaliculata]